MEITPLARRRRAAPAERVRADGERRFGDEERAVSRMFLWPTEHEVLRGAALPGIDVERRGPLFLVGYTVPPFRRWRRWQAARPFEGCLGRWRVFLALRLWAWLVQSRLGILNHEPLTSSTARGSFASHGKLRFPGCRSRLDILNVSDSPTNIWRLLQLGEASLPMGSFASPSCRSRLEIVNLCRVIPDTHLRTL